MLNESLNPVTLGENAYVAIGTQNISSSFFFYRKLGFFTVSEGELPVPWKIISDNSLIIQLIQDNKNYLKLTYFAENVPAKVRELEGKGISFVDKSFDENKNLTGGMFYTPENLPISLIKRNTSEIFPEIEKRLIDVNENELTNINRYPQARAGLFGEISLPVFKLTSALEFWMEIGFEPINVYQMPYPWAVLTDGMNVMGLHQATEFNYPAITYFAPDMAARIKRLKESGLSAFTTFGNKEELPKNVSLTSPEGQKFFLFTI